MLESPVVHHHSPLFLIIDFYFRGIFAGVLSDPLHLPDYRCEILVEVVVEHFLVLFVGEGEQLKVGFENVDELFEVVLVGEGELPPVIGDEI